ncbi:Hint domain-containing protein [Sagittula sp. SSi028]|uniref:Hint domain-containing protein n=1 Tax=Sagittula sp. SSi028 TaxID=3400636 RepID=UPI003AF728E0
MTTYAITAINWNDPSFWAGITEGSGGHSFDFTALPSNFSVDFDPSSSSLIIEDGSTSFVIQDASGSGGADATLGGATLLSYFTNVSGGAGHDSLQGGAGSDTLTGGDGRNTLEGGDGDDRLMGNAASGGHTHFVGGAGADTLDGSAGSYDIASYYNATTGVTIDLSDGLPETGGEAAGDVLIGIEQIDGSNTADDFIRTDDSGTQLKGWGGNDTLQGGAGNDRLLGGTGNDRLTGGAGDDRFFYAAGDGHDTITDFNTGNSGTLSDGNATNNDAIDLSAFYDSIFELHADQADDGILNQSNTETDYSNNAQFGSGSLTFDGASGDNSFFTAENTNVTCFTKGTAILTPTGDRLVEDLRVGDLVCTMDNGPQAIRWIGVQRFGRTVLVAVPRLHPVVLPQGVLGLRRPLRVSQQHGMLLGQDRLIRAKHLAQAPKSGVRIARGCRSVTYIHLLFDAHQIVFAEGAATESFYPGPMIRRMLHASARAQLRRIVQPKFFAGGAPSAPPGQVRGFLSGRAARDTLRRTPLGALVRPQM